MLKLAGEDSIGLEKIETISYTPNCQDSGDLEAGTHTIVPTSRPAIASAQYSASLTLPKPSDARLVVKRIAARLNVNIAGLGTATHVYCSVRVDVDDADHELFNEDWTSTGSKLDAVDTHSGNKSTIFNLLKDGSAHTFYFLFWADQASQATIDVVQLWEGVGSCATGGNPSCLEVSHTGFLQTLNHSTLIGTGVVSRGVLDLDHLSTTQNVADQFYLWLTKSGFRFILQGTVATDINHIRDILFVLRSEQ